MRRNKAHHQLLIPRHLQLFKTKAKACLLSKKMSSKIWQENYLLFLDYIVGGNCEIIFSLLPYLFRPHYILHCSFH